MEDTACIMIDLDWVKTLCDECHYDRVKAIKENKNKRELKVKVVVRRH